jgi:Mrp family chromosome partitioning ATPase
MIGFVAGGLAAAAWIIAANQLIPGADPVQPKTPATRDKRSAAAAGRPPVTQQARPQPAVSLIQKPLIARLQESDVMWTLGSILATGQTADVTRLGWPTLRAGFPLMTFLKAMREMRAALTKRAAQDTTPVLAVIGVGEGEDRDITALNIALSAARDGARVLMIDADHDARALSNKVAHLDTRAASRRGWLSIGSNAARAVETGNGIAILPVAADANGEAKDAKAANAVRKAITQARSAASYDLIVLDGPAMPWSADDLNLLDLADGLAAVLPIHLDINDGMEDIITALGGAERKLVGVVLSELNPVAVNRQRD